jgi:hypothetical protein
MFMYKRNILKILFILSLCGQAGLLANDKVYVEKVCTSCHSMSTILSQSGNKSFWNKMIVDMYANGLKPLSNENKFKIINYLYKQRPDLHHKGAQRRKPLVKVAFPPLPQ